MHHCFFSAQLSTVWFLLPGYTPIIQMILLWTYCLLLGKWLAWPWPWSVARAQRGRSPPPSPREYVAVSQSLMLPWMMNYIWHLCMDVSMCVCMYVFSLALDQCTRSLICQELPRGYVYFTVKTLKQTLNVAQAPQAGWLGCHQGAAYFDRFQLSVGVATLLLCYTTAGVTWRLSTDYVVLKYIPYVHTDMWMCGWESVPLGSLSALACVDKHICICWRHILTNPAGFPAVQTADTHTHTQRYTRSHSHVVG